MNVDILRKVVAVVGIALILGATYLNLLGILEANTDNDQATFLGFVISGNVVNGLAVMCLLILTATSPKFSLMYKLVLAMILLGGLVAELYLVGTELHSKNYGTYVAVLVNLLLRVYYLVYYFNESWAMFPASYLPAPSVSVIRETERVIIPPGASVDDITRGESEAFKERWKGIFRQAREKVGSENLSQASIDRGYKEVITPAINAKDFSYERLKEAASYLEDKSGNKVTGLVFGGKRKR